MDIFRTPDKASWSVRGIGVAEGSEHECHRAILSNALFEQHQNSVLHQ